MSGIYIHIPFCKQACHYCNFHFSTSLKYKEDMVAAIVKEIHYRKDFLKDKNLTSIYFGGGTPSLLSVKDLNLIFEAIAAHFSFNEEIEITLEANPDDLNEKLLEGLKSTYINRLSIGVQSFYEEDLKWMNRAHNVEEASRCIKLSQDSGLENISIDLIFGIPVSNIEKWRRNIEKAVEYNVPHVSAYALTVEEGTALNHFINIGKEKEVSDEYAMEQFDLGIEMFQDAGFLHYEISNFAKPGKLAVHNTNYWKSKSYMGIGPSAHSYDGQNRYANISHNARYLKGIFADVPEFTKEIIDPEKAYNEYVMTRLRTIWGIDPLEIKEFGKSYFDYFKSQVPGIIKKKWIIEKDGKYFLTRKGKHFSDASAMELFYDE